MKLFIILFLFSPFFITAQIPNRRDDSLRKTAGSMQFPTPFIFSKTNHTPLSKKQAFAKAGLWLQDIKDSLKAIKIVKDSSSQYRLTATHVAATADISFDIIIRIQLNQYTCSLQNYVFHTVNGKAIPLQKAVTLKEFKQTANIEKVIIMGAYPSVFKSLAAVMK
jgi:hypothetical protein